MCGSDIHLLHGTILQLQKNDILGHECESRAESFPSLSLRMIMILLVTCY